MVWFVSQGKAEELPLDDESVSLVTCASTVHWLDHEKFYRDCDRVLVPGGVIAVYSSILSTKTVLKHDNADVMTGLIKEVKVLVPIWSYINANMYIFIYAFGG